MGRFLIAHWDSDRDRRCSGHFNSIGPRLRGSRHSNWGWSKRAKRNSEGSWMWPGASRWARRLQWDCGVFRAINAVIQEACCWRGHKPHKNSPWFWLQIPGFAKKASKWILQIPWWSLVTAYWTLANQHKCTVSHQADHWWVQSICSETSLGHDTKQPINGFLQLVGELVTLRSRKFEEFLRNRN